MYKELWSIHGIKHVSFLNSEGDTVKGNQVFYSRSFYDSQEGESWLYGDFCPHKPQWLDETLTKVLISALQKSSVKSVVWACYEPQGRFNRLVSFESCYDEEIDIDNIDSSASV